ncbi:MAG: hypothetical protein IJW38_03545, partial [Clostridia bacterium]|nr:hypothetical protein [Clostridia bacterium]
MIQDSNCEESGGLFKIKDSAGAVSFPSKNWVAAQKAAIKTKAPMLVKAPGLSGAATQIRTGDLILTKDVLYQLS